MDISQIDKLGKQGHKVVRYSFIFLLIHTIFFLIRDGWHYSALTIEEKICDGISVAGLSIGLFIMFTAFFKAVTMLIYELKKLINDQ